MAGSQHKKLNKAKLNKNDEFYTQLSDIEKELNYYKEQLKDKIIFCNCDDPEYSNFWKYFELNFKQLGLKKLISTHFESSKPSYKLELMKDINGDGKINNLDIIKTPLKQNGDFRSPECIELLKEADIVVTNPPFSLFREYVAKLIEYDKKFIIIGNKNAITYREIFKLIKENKLRTGYRNINSDMWLILPENAKLWEKKENGKKLKHIMACWFTNLEVSKHQEKLILYKSYNKNDYPKYDNYDAINVNKVEDIPCNYDGVIGVPITFLDKHNPEQFEILALGNSRDNFKPNKDYINPKKIMKDGKIANGGAINCVLAIETDKKPVGQIHYTSDNSKYLLPPYARILIQKTKKEAR